MKQYRRWLVLLICMFLCIGAIWLILQVTAEYPTLGEPVDYPVNQVEGFELTIDGPSWSPFRGYSIRYKVAADSEKVYTFVREAEEPGFEYLECYQDGQWYRLGYLQDAFPFTNLEFAIGGATNHGLEGSLVQKYRDYGTRLHPGNYRLVLEMRAEDGTSHYLAAEFVVD